MASKTRCPWCERSDLMIAYHDEEWGVPVHDDRKLFEFMVLDAFQAGLSWSTILHKRENFRSAFANFEPDRVARFGKPQVGRLLRDQGIVRNRLKIRAAIANAGAFLDVAEEYGSFDAFIWAFVDGRPRQNAWRTPRQVPASTKESDRMSRALRDRGFTFVGTTICYAFMQAAGLVNDHLVDCFRHRQVRRAGRSRRA